MDTLARHYRLHYSAKPHDLPHHSHRRSHPSVSSKREDSRHAILATLFHRSNAVVFWSLEHQTSFFALLQEARHEKCEEFAAMVVGGVMYHCGRLCGMLCDATVSVLPGELRGVE